MQEGYYNAERNTFSTQASAPLTKSSISADFSVCKICGARADFCDVVGFYKCCSRDFYSYGRSEISISYYRCILCGFLFTPFFDDWTNEDFSKSVYNSEYHKVDPDYVSDRPQRIAMHMADRPRGCEHVKILDFGSGNGLFANLMRDAGFNRIDSYDPFSNPVIPEGKFEIITCFEVIEYSVDPLATITMMKEFLSPFGCIIFNQTLQPENIG